MDKKNENNIKLENNEKFMNRIIWINGEIYIVLFNRKGSKSSDTYSRKGAKNPSHFKLPLTSDGCDSSCLYETYHGVFISL